MLNNNLNNKWIGRALLVLVFALALPVAADCEYPNSERGTPPQWLCGEPSYEGFAYLAVGEKSRMPSISLQSRLAGKDAMTGVVKKLLTAAAEDISAQLPEGVSPSLVLPNAEDWKRVARFKGIKVADKTTSPVRTLYVLAGVPEEAQSALVQQARSEVLKKNRKALKAALAEPQWLALQEWVKRGG